MRKYLKDTRVGAAKGYDPKVDQLYGYNEEMAKASPFLKEIDLDDCKGWTNDIPFVYDPDEETYTPIEEAEVAGEGPFVGRTIVGEDAGDVIAAARAAADNGDAVPEEDEAGAAVGTSEDEPEVEPEEDEYEVPEEEKVAITTNHKPKKKGARFA
jgi:hypothetical protein